MPVLRLAGLLLAALYLNGCVAAHIIAGFKDLGLTPADRKAMLMAEVKKFHDSRMRGDLMSALGNVSTDSLEKIKQQLREEKRAVKIIDGQVEFVEYAEDGFEAKVEMAIKYRKLAALVIQDRIEQEDWTYKIAEGWKLVRLAAKQPL